MTVCKVSTSDTLPLPAFLLCREIEQYPKPLVYKAELASTSLIVRRKSIQSKGV
jgi:hypothetical protein